MLGKTSELAATYRDQVKPLEVDLYGRIREVLTFDRTFMLKTLKCPVRVVWIYRKTKWVALFTFAFSDVRRHITETVLSEDFPRICSREGKPALNSIAQAAKAMLRMAD